MQSIIYPHFTGNQVVQGRHSQKVHSGESVGANHRSQFHSEVRVSHKKSQPTTNHQLSNNPSQAMLPQEKLHRKNSKPVRVINHQWPPVEHFNDPRLHFNMPNQMGFEGNLAKFPTDDPLQRFFKPEYDPTGDLRLNPGFDRFFRSVNDFGPQRQLSKMSDKDSRGAITGSTATKALPGLGSSPPVEYSGENESDTSSIRSSASAYWPPELKFVTEGNQIDAVSWEGQKPAMKLRRISPPGHREERYK